jgi:RNA polymerase sigma-B factor
MGGRAARAYDSSMSTAPAPQLRCATRRPARRRPEALAEERALFAQYREEMDPALRDALIERFLPLARHLAARYEAPGHSYEDIFQVACLALVKAVDRFEPDRRAAFSSYAVPTVIGEIKRYFRDQTWAVHVTRELQERALHVGRAIDDTALRLGRQPRLAEIAAVVDCSEDEVLEALDAATAYRATSLEAPRRADDEAEVPLVETLGYDDERFAAVERRADLSGLVDRLSASERTVLRLRFERDLTQPEITDMLGVSQMHVSRILRGALERLRRLEAPAAHA